MYVFNVCAGSADDVNFDGTGGNVVYGSKRIACMVLMLVMVPLTLILLSMLSIGKGECIFGCFDALSGAGVAGDASSNGTGVYVIGSGVDHSGGVNFVDDDDHGVASVYGSGSIATCRYNSLTM